MRSRELKMQTWKEDQALYQAAASTLTSKRESVTCGCTASRLSPLLSARQGISGGIAKPGYEYVAESPKPKPISRHN
jgi:hypothetical protein